MAKAAEYQKQVDKKLEAKVPKYQRSYWWNAADTMPVTMRLPRGTTTRAPTTGR